MIEIEIDGKKLEVAPGSMIIEAADAAGINIPRFCYHKKLTVAANCRMCLVDVDKVGKALPACATPVTAGMKVQTCSQKALDAQRAVMEFLLINHPLDCPICDQGGECELQDNSIGYGPDISKYSEGKRTVKDKDIGPLIETSMTRCIQCTRCVRFGTEIAGMREMGAYNRGENLEIGTFIEKSLISEMSGNVIDLCPVGALVSKPFRYTARAWELKQHPSISPHDCIGSNIYVHTRTHDVMRVVPRENESLNETWISDRDRFSYTGLKSGDRLTVPMVKRGGRWQEVSWQEALEFATTKLKDLLHHHSAKQLAALISPSSTVEEFYLLQKLLRAVGCNNIDHRLHQTDFSHQDNMSQFPGLTIKLEELQNQEVILLIGSNIQREQPIAGHRVRKASLQGCKIININCVDNKFNFPLAYKYIVKPSDLIHSLAQIAKALLLVSDQKIPENALDFLSNITINETARSIAEQLLLGERKLIILGAIAQNHPHAGLISEIADLISSLCNAKIAYLTEGANAAGAWLAGAVPHRTAASVNVNNPGLNASSAITANLKGYILFNVEPDCDLVNPHLALKAIDQAEVVISFSTFKSPALMLYADVLLPIAPFAEMAGTYINAEGTWQSFMASTLPQGDVRPAWKVIRVLGNLMGIADFDYISAEQIRDELKSQIEAQPFNSPAQQYKHLTQSSYVYQANNLIERITEWPIYRVDALVRRSIPLQQSGATTLPAVYLNDHFAQQLTLSAGHKVSVKQGDNVANLSVIIDEKIPDDCVYIPAGFSETAKLGESFGNVEIGSAHD